MVKVVLGLLIILTIFFAVAFLRDYIKATKEGNIEKTNFFALGVVGFITNFFDTLGIGSFSPTTALLKNFKLSKDRTLPGTLNVACTVPVAAEAILFINGIEVEPVTLFSLLIAATVGAVVAAGVVSKLDERKVQFAMGTALIIVALVMLAGKLNLMPAGGDAVGLHGAKLIIAIIGNFILGALMTLGIGLYAPCMALVYSLGMSQRLLFQ